MIMPGTDRIAVYGTGGFAREVAWLIESLPAAGRPEIVCFVDDDARRHGDIVNGIPVWSVEQLRERHPGCAVACAIGKPQTRRKVVGKCRDMGFVFPTLCDRDVRMSRFVGIGDGSILCAGSVVTVDVAIGEQTHVNLNCTIGHDCRIGAYTTLAPGVHVSGCVHIGEGVYIGTGACIINGTQEAPLTIGSNSVIGAGACVTRSIAPDVTAVGVPARTRG